MSSFMENLARLNAEKAQKRQNQTMQQQREHTSKPKRKQKTPARIIRDLIEDEADIDEVREAFREIIEDMDMSESSSYESYEYY
jgi:soluble cytochrome b562